MLKPTKSLVIKLIERKGADSIHKHPDTGNDYVILHGGKQVGTISYIVHPNQTVSIQRILIFDTYRRQGLGTACILQLHETYKGCEFYGDIWYPGALNFWRSLKTKLDFGDTLDFYSDIYGCDFVFK